MDLVKNKVSDYKLEHFNKMLENFLDRLPGIVSSEALIAEMKRFLPTDVFDRTLAQDKFQVYLQNTLAKLFKTVSNELLGNVTNNEFRM